MDAYTALREQMKSTIQIGLNIGNKFSQVLGTTVAWNGERDWLFEKSIFVGAKLECSIGEITDDSTIIILTFRNQTPTSF